MLSEVAGGSNPVSLDYPAPQDKDLEVCSVNLKLDQLEAELQDLNSQESKDEASLAKVWPRPLATAGDAVHCPFSTSFPVFPPAVSQVKKQMRDLEAKVKDQEEELDEQAGTIQMLEQVQMRITRNVGKRAAFRVFGTFARSLIMRRPER